MKTRIKVTPILKGLFCNIPIESGMPDNDIITSVNPRIPHKTFARIRITPPASVTSEQVLMIARLAACQTGVDSASVLGLVRRSRQGDFNSLSPWLAARTFSRSKMVSGEVTHVVQSLTTASRRILLFDRDNSFDYLTPCEEPSAESDARSPIDLAMSAWSLSRKILRFERQPRVLVTLARGSLSLRQSRFGDYGLEHLIGGVESGEHGLTIVNDRSELSHRVFRGVFEKAQAVAIFGRTAMLVLPEHGHSFRLFEVHRGNFHANYIRESIGLFHRMRRFRVHGPSVISVVDLLRPYLSYRSPQW